MRGYCAIGILGSKTKVNVGTLWRTAAIYDAAFMFTVGRRFPKQASDTIKAYRHIPYFEFSDIGDLKDHLPHGCPLVGVELAKNPRFLSEYTHPERACYLLGAEDSGIPKNALETCNQIVQIDTPREFCLNVATAGSILLYDRHVKSLK